MDFFEVLYSQANGGGGGGNSKIFVGDITNNMKETEKKDSEITLNGGSENGN